MPIVDLLERIKDLVWSPLLLGLLLGVGLYLTIILRGIQWRYLGYALRLAFFQRSTEASKAKGDLTHFQALMTSLAAAIGTGNIAGVATAVATGGLGALFWMWVIAFLGMAIKYAESLVAVVYREENSHGEMSGGPMYYLSKGLGWKKGAMAFAFFGILATIGTGNFVQVHSVTDALTSLYPINPWACGFVLAAITAIVLFGGVKSIGKVAEYFVPLMACIYLAGGLYIVLSHLTYLPEVLWHILQSAFRGEAAVGGFVGSSINLTIQSGIARGVFSNEAGLGTSSIASAAAITDEPGEQAMVAMTSAFLSTMVVCSVTGLVIGLTDVLGQVDAQSGKLLNGAPMAMKAFGSQLIGGEYWVTIGLIFFAYSTILGWAYYGEKCVEYLAGTRAITLYRLVYVVSMVPAAALELQAVWAIADIANGLMAIPNLLGLVAFSKLIKQETAAFCQKIERKRQFYPARESVLP